MYFHCSFVLIMSERTMAVFIWWQTNIHAFEMNSSWKTLNKKIIFQSFQSFHFHFLFFFFLHAQKWIQSCKEISSVGKKAKRESKKHATYFLWVLDRSLRDWTPRQHLCGLRSNWVSNWNGYTIVGPFVGW